jgi:indole-3-glycerol phosphate synthase
MGFLSTYTIALRERLEEQPLDVEELEARLARVQPPQDMVAALTRNPPALIAEVKRASPSAGAITFAVDPATRARAYSAGGASAVSVLTEPTHFGGSLADLDAVRSAVDLPLLRKDFVVHTSQVLEARAHGADSVLLIVDCLSDDELASLLAESRDLGMEPLLEAHGDEDLTRALATDARIVGVNARDLESLEVDLTAALTRLRRVPGDRVAILESGIGARSQVEAALEAGATAILVGEALMRSGDPAGAIRDLRGSV